MTSLPSSLNSVVGHLAIIDDKHLTDQLGPILIQNKAAASFFGFAKVQTLALLFQLPLTRFGGFRISQMSGA